jgi:hypothetical protein
MYPFRYEFTLFSSLSPSFYRSCHIYIGIFINVLEKTRYYITFVAMQLLS